METKDRLRARNSKIFCEDIIIRARFLWTNYEINDMMHNESIHDVRTGPKYQKYDLGRVSTWIIKYQKIKHAQINIKLR